MGRNNVFAGQLCLAIPREDGRHLIKERIEEGYGVESLMNYENIALLTNIKVEELKKYKSLADMEEMLPLVKCTKIQKRKLKCFFEMARRFSKEARGAIKSIKSPEDVFKLLVEDMRFLKKEIFVAVLLDTKNNVLDTVRISEGSLNSSICHPRECFRPALIAAANAIIFAHNHPSDSPNFSAVQPSNEDIETSKRLVEVGNLIGIKVLDSIVIGQTRYCSLKESGYIG